MGSRAPRSSHPFLSQQQHPLLGSWLRSSSLPAYGLFTPIRVILFLSALVLPNRSPVAVCSGRAEGYIPMSTHPQNNVSSLSIPLVSFAHLPLWLGPRKTSGKGPSAWQLKDALEPVSVIPSLLDSEGSLSVWGVGGRKEKNVRVSETFRASSCKTLASTRLLHPGSLPANQSHPAGSAFPPSGQCKPQLPSAAPSEAQEHFQGPKQTHTYIQMTQTVFRVVCWFCLAFESKVSDLSKPGVGVPFNRCRQQVPELEVPMQDPNCILNRTQASSRRWGGGPPTASVGHSWE